MEIINKPETIKVDYEYCTCIEVETDSDYATFLGIEIPEIMEKYQMTDYYVPEEAIEQYYSGSRSSSFELSFTDTVRQHRTDVEIVETKNPAGFVIWFRTRYDSWELNNYMICYGVSMNPVLVKAKNKKEAVGKLQSLIDNGIYLKKGYQIHRAVFDKDRQNFILVD